jgi:hypothetical protein
MFGPTFSYFFVWPQKCFGVLDQLTNFSFLKSGTESLLCPFAVYCLRYAVTLFFTMSRISLAEGKTAGQKVHLKIAGAVQNVKPLYFLSRYFEIRIHF